MSASDLIALFTGYVPPMHRVATSADTWQAVGAIGSMLGAIAAAIGAGAAWRAASAARATSADALEALAVGMAPDLTTEIYQRTASDSPPAGGVGEPFKLVLNVRNSARWPASDVDVRAEFQDGRAVHERLERLDPMDQDGDLDMTLRTFDASWPGPEWEPITITVRYSDARGIARYEQRTVQKVRARQPLNGPAELEPEPMRGSLSTTRRLR